MVKADYARDYYNDLELAADADTDTIKKQFRKLALKYHPDRNPGREDEFNEKFQVIQSAHEILTNPEQKAKYDVNRRSGRPSASGVRGNPWADVSSNFPPPPRRTGPSARPAPQARHPTSTARQYAEFARDVPPTPPRYPNKPAESAGAYQAWENMKGSTRGKASPTPGSVPVSAAAAAASANVGRKVPPPPKPPRRQDSEKKSGPFGQKTTRSSTQRTPTAATGSTSTNGGRSAASDSYTRLFNETSASTRAGRRPASSTFRPGDGAFVDERQSTPYQTHGGEKLNPFEGVAFGQGNSGRGTPVERENASRSRRHTHSTSNSDVDGGPTQTNEPGQERRKSAWTAEHMERETDEPTNGRNAPQSARSSNFNVDGGNGTIPSNGFAQNGSGGSDMRPPPNVFNINGNNFPDSSHRFTRNSTDNINTRFVNDDDTNSGWQFNAGGATANGTSRAAGPPRSKSSSRANTRDFSQSTTRQSGHGDEADGGSGGTGDKFNPAQWSEHIVPAIFEPPAGARNTGSPTRPNRRQSRKTTKPVLRTMGTAGLVDDEASSMDERSAPTSRAGFFAAEGEGGMESPNAMDIDPPLAQTAEPQEYTTPRKVPVEPTRQEWRAGGVNAGKPPQTTTGPPPKPPKIVPSEDDQDFKPNLKDFHNVEPFSPPKATGLDSFGDLREQLPFQSQAASGFPIERKPVPGAPSIGTKNPGDKLQLPLPPRAPHAPTVLAVPSLKPSTVVWQKYVKDFIQYMEQWHDYNTRFVDHFAARDKEVQQVRGLDRSYNWLQKEDNVGIDEYMRWAEEDREVRARWTQASNEHEKRTREFAMHREKMK